MNQKLQKNSVSTLNVKSILKLIFSVMFILAFSFSTQNAVAQKNVVAGLLPTISVDSLVGKTNSSRIYITDGVKETIVTKSEKNTKTIKKEEHFEPYIHQIQLDTELSALFNDLNLNKRYLSEVKASFNLNKYNKKAQKELAQPISLKIGPFCFWFCRYCK